VVTVANVPGLGIYTASKCALVGHSAVLAVELAPFGIQVTTVLPGPFNTRFGSATLPPAKKGEASAKLYSARAAAVTARRLPGSTELSAKPFIDLAKSASPRSQILLWKMANDSAFARAEANLRELGEWAAVGSKVDVE
jgi:NAD(P)-dependent dehydrogenase (short-subunit alcohol dehydrogenase family)